MLRLNSTTPVSLKINAFDLKLTCPVEGACMALTCVTLLTLLQVESTSNKTRMDLIQI